MDWGEPADSRTLHCLDKVQQRIKIKASKKGELAEGSSSDQTLIFHGTYNIHIIPALSELVFLMGNGIN